MQMQTTSLQKKIPCEILYPECNEDFILPDYMPEIRRVLRLSATRLPEEPYVGADATEFEGRVVYRLLYSDPDGILTEVPLESRYRYRVPNAEKEICCAFAEESVESVAGRPLAARKMNVRTRLCAKPTLLYEEEAQPTLAHMLGGRTEDAEILMKELSTVKTVFLPSGELQIDARFPSEGAFDEGTRVLSGVGEILTEAAEAREGHVYCRGQVNCSFLLCEEGGHTHTLTKKLPFEAEIPSPLCHEGDSVTVESFCRAPELLLEEDSEKSELSLTVGYYLFALLRHNETLSVIGDMYLTQSHAETQTATLSGESLVGSYVGNVTVGGDCARTSEQAGTPLGATVTLRGVSATPLHDRAVIEGEAQASVLFLTDSGDGITEDLTFPFRIEAPVGERTAEEDRIAFSLSPVSVSCLTKENSVSVSAELGVSCGILRPYETKIPCSVNRTADREKASFDCLKVYYPNDKDSLWSVGKKYGVSLSLLKKQNGIPDGDAACDMQKSIDGYSYLLVSAL